MTENFTCKYLLGTCFSYQKCLHCFKLPQPDSCKCKKNKRPLRTKKPKHGHQIYQRVYNPDPSFPKANEFLLDANIKFDYNSNFEEKFSYTFCGTCNSKYQRLRCEDRATKQDISSNKKETDDSDACIIDIEEDKEEKEDSDNDLDEIKIQIIVKSKNIEMPSAKTLTITSVDYESIMEKINSEVQKVLKEKIRPKDYTISYKAVNARGPSNTLEDMSDFQEFINEYRKVFSSGKKMLVMVAMRNKKRSVKKHQKVKKTYLYIFY